MDTRSFVGGGGASFSKGEDVGRWFCREMDAGRKVEHCNDGTQKTR
jgi:hypothetical protein